MSQNLTYKLEQNFPVDFFAKQTLEIKDGKIIRAYKNIFREYSKSYDLKDIDSNYAKGRRAYDQWENLVWIFAILPIVSNWIHINPLVDLVLILSSLLLALIFFLLKFKKYDNVYFNDCNNNFIFGIRFTSKSKNENLFLNTLVEEINKAKNQNGNN